MGLYLNPDEKGRCLLGREDEFSLLLMTLVMAKGSDSSMRTTGVAKIFLSSDLLFFMEMNMINCI